MLSEEDLELIERYLDNDLPQSEKELFEARLVNEEQLRSTLNEQKAIVQTLKNSQNENLRTELKSIVSQSEVVPLRKDTGFNYKIAASIALLVSGLLAIYLIFLNPAEKTPEEIFIAYYEPYPVSL